MPIIRPGSESEGIGDAVKYWTAFARQRLRRLGLAPDEHDYGVLLEAVRLLREQLEPEELRPDRRPP